MGLPVQDIDLATTFPAEQALEVLSSAGYKVIPTGIDHGTITVVLRDIPYEITTLRRDVETHGRRATICYTDNWQEDASRRDFTFNALYQSFDGEVYDFFGGREDLTQGIVRFIGSPLDRIKEDYLRILRLFRFYARYGKIPLDCETLEICGKFTSHLKSLSIERVTHEVLMLLALPECLKSIEAMSSSGVLSVLFHHYDLPRFRETLQREFMISLLSHKQRVMRRLVALTDDYNSLRLSNTQKKYVKIMGDFHRQGIQSENWNLYCYLRGSDIVADYLLIFSQTPPEEIISLLTQTIPEFPLKGQDVMALGVPKGPEVKKCLDAVLEWWCQGGFVADREACVAWLKKIPLL